MKKVFAILLLCISSVSGALIISDSLQYYFAKRMQDNINYGSVNDSVSIRFLSGSTELAVIKTGNFGNPSSGTISAVPRASAGLTTGTPTIWELINKAGVMVMRDSIGNGIDFTGSITSGVNLSVPATFTINVPYATGVVTPPDTVDAVTFDPVGETYAGTQNVSLSTDTTGTTIHYHLSGTTTFSTYSTAISITATDSIYAYASKSGLANSDTVSALYTISSGVPDTVVRIDFTTTGSQFVFGGYYARSGVDVQGEIHLSDTTYVMADDAGFTRDWGSSATRNHYVLIRHPASLDNFTVSNSGNHLTSFIVTHGALLTDFSLYINEQDITNWNLDNIGITNLGAGYMTTTGIQADSLRTDYLYHVVNDGGKSNGVLYINDNRTAASDADNTAIIGKGWTINLRGN